MTKIYTQHDAAFNRVSAYVILRNGEHVAKVAFKFPADGAGRLYAYVHWFGIEMVRGYANGYGYDKKSAAVEDAISAAAKRIISSPEKHSFSYLEFCRALTNIGGNNWDRALVDAGFTVIQAI